MRYTYVASPDDEYLLFHRAVASVSNNKVTVIYTGNSLRRTIPATYISKTGIVLYIHKTINSLNTNNYHMYIPETNDYFNTGVLLEGLATIEVNDSNMLAIKHSARKLFRKTLGEYKSVKNI